MYGANEPLYVQAREGGTDVLSTPKVMSISRLYSWHLFDVVYSYDFPERSKGRFTIDLS